MPVEIETEIIKSLPIKSLIRFRSVSKSWKSLIDSSKFNVDYHVRHTQPQQHLLVRYTAHSNHYADEFFSLVDDDTFPKHKFRLNFPMPMSVKRVYKIIGSSQGLICFYRFDGHRDDSGMVVVWNPSIKKYVVIDVPNELNITYNVFGFGVCHKTSDPKLVKISFARSPPSLLPWQVEVFSLSSRTWRNISINLPRKSIDVGHKGHVFIDGVMYWLAFDITNGVEIKTYNLVISFDLASEEFTEIYLPDELEQRLRKTLLIYKPTKSLAVVQSYYEDQITVSDVWIMEHGVFKNRLLNDLL